MKSLVIFIVVLCVVSSALSCKVTYDVTPDTIDRLPLLVLATGSQYVAHVRNTGNLEGLLAIYLVVNGEEKDVMYFRTLPEWKEGKTDLYTFKFDMSDDMITTSSLRIHLIDPYIEHSTEYEYRVPLELIQKKNDRVADFDSQALVTSFSEKKYEINRETPNQELEPTS
jgi:hypothetical protein